jgi:hypothetical protein
MSSPTRSPSPTDPCTRLVSVDLNPSYPRGEDISPGGRPQVMTGAEVPPDVIVYPLPLDHRPLEPPGVGPGALRSAPTRLRGLGRRQPITVDVVALAASSGVGQATSARGRERSSGRRLR